MVLLLSATACSTSTTFVVINSSDQVLQVSYRVKAPPPGLQDSIRMLPIAPAVLPESEIDGQTPWRDLSESEVQFSPASRTVVVLLQPGDALRVDRRNTVDGPQDDASQYRNFGIEEITLTGSTGIAQFIGEQARKAFTLPSKRGRAARLIYK